jgi:hypothetical protein
MTVRELLEKTPGNVIIVDGRSRCDVTPWNIFYDLVKDCVIDTITPTDANELEITLKTVLLKKEG